MSDKQTCEEYIGVGVHVGTGDIFPGQSGYLRDRTEREIILFMAKRIDEQQRTIEELTKKVEMLSKIAGVE
jgi:hypothetical protein